ncbi:glycosyltransferase [Rhizohabitans arisaemae]|uniref:glycosyltransferase n=1 Tax=Rhizohabitans arisaemae TaxID=2720610 RepID=UPI0024B18137|nr:glycosyltransferase [Rhizohabitans arisaemae]
MTSLPRYRGVLVFVTVGTDHHRFDRLMDWMEVWLDDPGLAGVRCVIQHGASRPVAGAECHEFLPHDRMREMFSLATVVVTQGGPGSIAESRAAGRLPIVVPRIPELGEVVDDHQLRFARHLAERDRIALAETGGTLFAHLDGALTNPAGYTVEPGTDETGEAVARFAGLVDSLLRDKSSRTRSRLTEGRSTRGRRSRLR